MKPTMDRSTSPDTRTLKYSAAVQFPTQTVKQAAHWIVKYKEFLVKLDIGVFLIWSE